MSSVGKAEENPATFAASSSGTPSPVSSSMTSWYHSRSAPRTSFGSSAHTPATRSPKKAMVSVIWSGCGRLLSSQRVPRSTRRRECRRTRVWTSAATLLSSASTASHTSARPKISRAASCARTISSVEAPVSSRRRCRKVEPPVLTVSLTRIVVMISRRSACASICSANLSPRAAGKYAKSRRRRYGSSGSSVTMSSSAVVILVYANSTASSGWVSPLPLLSSSRICRSVGRNSSSRLSSPAPSRRRMKRCWAWSRLGAWAEPLASAVFCA